MGPKKIVFKKRRAAPSTKKVPLKGLLSDHEPKHFFNFLGYGFTLKVTQEIAREARQAIEQALKAIYGHVQSVKLIYCYNFYQMYACRSVIYR